MSELDAGEIQELRDLLEIERIRKVKQLFCLLMDSHQIDALADLYTEDAICEFGPDFGNWEGRETIRTNYHGVFDGQQQFAAMHHCTNHYVELTGPDTATGRCYLIDVVTTTAPEDQPIVWFGVYDEGYQKVAGKWLIKRCSLQFLWPARKTMPGFETPYPQV
jgi:ketosteroid isomerase-like protein